MPQTQPKDNQEARVTGNNVEDNAVQEDNHEDQNDPVIQQPAPDDILGNLGQDDGDEEEDNGRSNVRHDSNNARRKVLREKLVVEYKQKKEEKDSASVDDDNITHTSRLKNNAKADSIAEYLGYGSIGGAAASALGPYVASGLIYAGGGIGAGIGAGASGISSGKEAAGSAAREVWDTTKKSASTVRNHETSKDVFDSIGIAGNVSGTIGAGIKLGSNIYRSRRDKNKYKRRAAKYRAASGAFWGAAEITNGLSRGGNLGLFGERARVEGSGSQKIGGALDIASGTTSFIANILNYTANRAEKADHKKASEDTERYMDQKSEEADTALTASRNTIGKYKNRKTSELTEEETQELKLARKRRNTAKAQKYAMAQASKLHKLRSEESTKELIGMIGGGIGMLSAGLSGTAKLLGNTGGILGLIGTGLSAIAGVTKTIGGLTDFKKGKDEKKKLAKSKHEVVDAYLAEKVDKIKEQASAMQLDGDDEANLGARGKTITNEEAKRAAIMRLGVDLPDSSEKIPDDAYDAAFKKLTEKRANNILRSSGEEKEAMLAMLGLDKDATFEDVYSALEAG